MSNAYSVLINTQYVICNKEHDFYECTENLYNPLSAMRT